MNNGRSTTLAVIVNLLIPGAGIILLGWIWVGLIVGLVFVLCANYALWATLLIPDEFSAWMRGLGIGLAGGTYFGAQLRLAWTVRRQQQQRYAALRRAALAAVQTCLRRGDYTAAVAAIRPIRQQADRDLLIAYRWAQVATGMRDVEAAWAAWRRVRALDPHRIYRDEIRANQEALARVRPEPEPLSGPPRDQA